MKSRVFFAFALVSKKLVLSCPTNSTHTVFDHVNDTDATTKASSTSSKPNILLIMADDVGTGDIPFYWNSGLVNMPNIQRLANLGVTFKRAHSTPLCAPSRYSLLSGNYPHRGQYAEGTWTLAEESSQFIHTQKSIAWVLRNWAGYHTMMAGKWHVGGKIPRKGAMQLNESRILTAPSHDWSRPIIDGPQDIGFDYSYITSGGIQEQPYSFFRDGYLTTKSTDIKFWEKGIYMQDKGMSIVKAPGEGDMNWDSTAFNQIVVNETIDFIDDHVKNYSRKPFFAYAALGAVHIPHSPPDTYLDGTKIKGVYPTRHMDMLMEMDKSVGSLMDAIDERDLTSNTIVIFTSDNGGVPPKDGSEDFNHYSSGKLRGNKGGIFEGGTRIPLVVSWKGRFWQGTKRDHYVSLSDIYATLCELVGVGTPADSAQDSVSFAKYLYSKRNTDGLRKWLPTWAYKNGLRKAEAIIHNNLKAIRHIDITTGVRTWELYDLDKDPSEKNNIAREPQYAKIKRKMFRRLTLIGPCPNRDRKKPFILRHGPMKGKSVTCNFFNEKEKCDVYFIDGERFCQSKCNRHKLVCKH